MLQKVTFLIRFHWMRFEFNWSGIIEVYQRYSYILIPKLREILCSMSKWSRDRLVIIDSQNLSHKTAFVPVWCERYAYSYKLNVFFKLLISWKTFEVKYLGRILIHIVKRLFSRIKNCLLGSSIIWNEVSFLSSEKIQRMRISFVFSFLRSSIRFKLCHNSKTVWQFATVACIEHYNKTLFSYKPNPKFCIQYLFNSHHNVFLSVLLFLVIK